MNYEMIMKNKFQHLLVDLTMLAGWLALNVAQAAGLAAANTPAAIPVGRNRSEGRGGLSRHRAGRDAEQV